jgi:hypothetical protein
MHPVIRLERRPGGAVVIPVRLGALHPLIVGLIALSD